MTLTSSLQKLASLKNACVAMALAIVWLGTHGRACRASIASDVETLTGSRTKIVFDRRSDDPGWSGDDWDARGPNWTLMVFDTAEGGERVLLDGPSSYYVPTITPDGAHVIYSSYTERKVYIVDWDGGNKRELVLQMTGAHTDRATFAACVHMEANGTQWVYASTGDYVGPIYRFRIDNPSVNELVWDQFNVACRFRVSGDGLYGAFENADGRRNVWFAPLPNGSPAGPFDDPNADACNTQLAPDNSYRIFHMVSSHKTIEMYDSGGTNLRTIDVTQSLGFADNQNMWAPRWSNDARFFTITGPLSDLPSANVFLVEFDEGFTAVESYIQVTTVPCSNYAYAWVDPNTSEAVIDSFSVTPSEIAPGESCVLAWQTTDATSVSIDQGIGAVAADGSTTVTPDQTTTYTLTAVGGGVTRTFQLTVTVSPFRIPENPTGTESGLVVEYFGLLSPVQMPDFSSLFPYTYDVVPAIDYPSSTDEFATSGRATGVGAVFEGFVEIPTDGLYTFYLESNDGSALWIGTTKVVDGEAQTAMTEASGSIDLGAGVHSLAVEYFQNDGGSGLIMSFEGPSVSKQTIPAARLFHDPASIPAAPSITLTCPNGGEVWYVGTTRHIMWSTTNLSNVAIRYLYDEGGADSWRPITDSLHDFESGWGNYAWTVPDEPSAACRMAVAGYFGETSARSENHFEIRSVTDADLDGMDDGWEVEQFGDMSHDATSDADGDSMSDYSEFMNGTDPLVSSQAPLGSAGSGVSCASGTAASPASGLCAFGLLILAAAAARLSLSTR